MFSCASFMYDTADCMMRLGDDIKVRTFHKHAYIAFLYTWFHKRILTHIQLIQVHTTQYSDEQFIT